MVNCQDLALSKANICHNNTNIKRKVKKMENLKPIAFRIDESLVKKFREVVKKSGYKQSFLISKAMKDIIKKIEREQNEEK